jgi:hypothetical protein
MYVRELKKNLAEERTVLLEGIFHFQYGARGLRSTFGSAGDGNIRAHYTVSAPFLFHCAQSLSSNTPHESCLMIKPVAMLGLLASASKYSMLWLHLPPLSLFHFLLESVCVR